MFLSEDFYTDAVVRAQVKSPVQWLVGTVRVLESELPPPLLKHHHLAAPVARGHLINLRPPHATAVLIENVSGEKWSVDLWTRNYGEPPEIMSLARWLDAGKFFARL